MNRITTLTAVALSLAVSAPALARDVTAQNTSELAFDTTETILQSSVEFTADLETESQIFNSETTEVAQVFGGFNRPRPKRWYVGGSLGIFFPNLGDGFGDDADDTINTGFGGSVVGGYKFNRNWSAEVEGVFLGGGFDEDDLGLDADYSVSAFLFSPRYTFPLGDSIRRASRWTGYLGAGVGFANGEVEVEGEDFDTDTSFAFQVKGGVGYKFNPQLEGFLQLRYLNVTETDSDIDDSGFSTISPEIGVMFKF